MTIPLVRAGAWELAQAEDDPFADERPDWVECEIGWDVVTSGFEVDTGLCTYGAFVQPVLAEIAKGDQLELRMTRHQPSEPPSGHLGLALGQEIVFETVLPISGSDGTGESPVEVRWEATADVEVSTALHLHLHDDGPNVYRLASLTVTNR